MTTAPGGDMAVPAGSTHRDAPQIGFRLAHVGTSRGSAPGAAPWVRSSHHPCAGTNTNQGAALGAGQANRGGLHDNKAARRTQRSDNSEIRTRTASSLPALCSFFSDAAGTFQGPHRSGDGDATARAQGQQQLSPCNVRRTKDFGLLCTNRGDRRSCWFVWHRPRFCHGK